MLVRLALFLRLSAVVRGSGREIAGNVALEVMLFDEPAVQEEITIHDDGARNVDSKQRSVPWSVTQRRREHVVQHGTRGRV